MRPKLGKCEYAVLEVSLRVGQDTLESNVTPRLMACVVGLRHCLQCTIEIINVIWFTFHILLPNRLGKIIYICFMFRLLRRGSPTTVNV